MKPNKIRAKDTVSQIIITETHNILFSSVIKTAVTQKNIFIEKCGDISRAKPHQTRLAHVASLPLNNTSQDSLHVFTNAFQRKEN